MVRIMSEHKDAKIDLSKLGVKIDPTSLKSLKERSRLTRRRFDYEGIKKALVEAGKRNIGLTFRQIKQVMSQYDAKQGVIHNPQVYALIERLDKDPDVQVGIIEGLGPRIYVFRPANTE